MHGYIARLVRVAAVPLLLTGAVTGTALAAPATAAVARTGSSGPAASSVTGGVLNGVAATSASNAWAVGSAGGKTLIERWNGTAWTQVPSPSPGTGASLSGVAVTSAGDAWAVGSASGKTLIEGWNGTAWTQVPSPGPAGSVLKGVTATSATSAWAVGAAGPAGSSKTLTLRWDGAAWKQVPSPSPAAGSVLNGVAGTAAAAASDPIVGDWHVTYGAPAVVKMTLSGGVYTETAKTPVRVVGSSCDLPAGTVIATFSATGSHSYSGQHGLWFTSNCSFDQQTSWNLTLSSNGNTLTGVIPAVNETITFTKVSAGNAWAVGSASGKTLILGWNGTAWK